MASMLGAESHLEGYLRDSLIQYLEPLGDEYPDYNKVEVVAAEGKISLRNLVFKSEFVFMLTGLPVALEMNRSSEGEGGPPRPHVEEVKVVRAGLHLQVSDVLRR